jgi:hypothetical protein
LAVAEGGLCRLSSRVRVPVIYDPATEYLRSDGEPAAISCGVARIIPSLFCHSKLIGFVLSVI